MQTLIGAAALLSVAAITPGPNNVIVLRAASRGGVLAALPAVVGVVGGGLTMCLMALAGLGALVAASDAWMTMLTLAGAAWLVWMGIGMIRAGLRAPGASRDANLPTHGFLGTFAFQFINPKAWIMVLTVTAAVRDGSHAASLQLLALFVLIPTACLVAWAILGAMLARALRRPRVHRLFHCIMGALLIGAAVSLPISH